MAFDVQGGTFTMTDGTITGCTATSGGGVYVQGGTFNMTGGSIINNSSSQEGGGVAILGGEFNISGSAAISKNTARRGGGVEVSGGTFTMRGGMIQNNKAWGPRQDEGGGGIAVFSGTFRYENGAISGNTASNGRWPDVFVASGVNYANSASGETQVLTNDITTVDGLTSQNAQPMQ